jgi:hypothetical protein
MSIRIFFLLAVSAFAQPPLITPPDRIDVYRQMREYLQLTNAQFDAILRNNNEFNQWASGKQRRMAQVRDEIAVETAREVLVAGALGIRYAEVEGIRRHIADRRKELYTLNHAVLTDAQKVKFKALEEALKLDPVITGARAANLLPGVDNCSFADILLGGVSGILCRPELPISFLPGVLLPGTPFPDLP